MKHLAQTVTAFVAGALIASAVWGVFFTRYRAEAVAGITVSLHAQAGAGEQMLKYLDDPQQQRAVQLSFMASNMVVGFPTGIDMCEEQHPSLHVKQRWTSEYRRYTEFLQERQTRCGSNSPAAPRH